MSKYCSTAGILFLVIAGVLTGSCRQTYTSDQSIGAHANWEGENKTLSVAITSPFIPGNVDLELHMEGVFVHGGADTKYPYCRFDQVETEGDDTIHIIAMGKFNDKEDWPFELKLMVAKKAHRIIIEGEFTQFPESFRVTAMCPCLRGSVFSTFGQHPFQMARNSFFFLEDGGFTWISDAERGRAEGSHTEREGPWIQVFKTVSLARDESSDDIPPENLPWSLASGPDNSSTNLVGWMSYDGNYMIGLASDEAYQVGTRWGPCLHSDPRMIYVSGDRELSFRSVVYVLPPEPDLLLNLYHQDFNETQIAETDSHPDALWPPQDGKLLDGMEGSSLKAWAAEFGAIEPYGSDSDYIWVNQHAGGKEYPEGVMEGKGSMLWDIPASTSRACLSRILETSVTGPWTYRNIGLEAVNRGSKKTELELSVFQEENMLGRGIFSLGEMTNRRMMVGISDYQPGKEIRLEITIDKEHAPARIVLDNLRGFVAVDQ